MDDPGYTVSWLTLALINAGLAQGKRRSGLIWFVISVAFGPFATLWIVAAVPQPPVQPEIQPQIQPEAGPAQVRPAHGS